MAGFDGLLGESPNSSGGRENTEGRRSLALTDLHNRIARLLRDACRRLARTEQGLLAAAREACGKLRFVPKTMRSPYESLVRAIAHQHLHRSAAEAISRPLDPANSPKKIPFASGFDLSWKSRNSACAVFPHRKPGRSKTLPKRRLTELFRQTVKLSSLSDDQIIERLTEIYGVGRWTVEMLLIFQLGRMDVWPVDDFGVPNRISIFQA